MKKRKYMADINITPFVDVMLVLLVIFLVAAPVVMSQVPVSLPKTATPNSVSNKKPIFITLTATGKIYVEETLVQNTLEMKEKLKQIGITQEDTVYIRGDKDVPYGNMMSLMNDLNKMNFKVSLITEQE